MACDCNNETFQEIQKNIENCCASEGALNNSLCRAIAAGNAASSKPISCMLELINNYMKCGTEIPQSKVDSAYSAFVSVTGYQNFDYSSLVKYNSKELESIASSVPYYLILPIAIIFLTAIWIAVISGWIDWGAGLYATVFIVVLLLLFSLLYRQHVKSSTNNLNGNVNNLINEYNDKFKEYIAYWNQGMMAAACAITCKNGEKCWTCNDENGDNRTCIPCSSQSKKNQKRNSK